MRPIDRPVLILNTLDPLGKFNGKAEDGFLVGYSCKFKAFSVFNSQTRKVEENLHVNFLENKPNVAGPNWLFDIDSLTNSMNCQPITVGNQTNKNAVPKEANVMTEFKKSVAKLDNMKKDVSYSTISSKKEASEQSDAVRKEFEAQCNRELLQGKATKASSTNNFNIVSTPVNAASAPRTSNDAGPSFVPLGGSFPLNVNDLPDDPLMPDLEDTAKVQNTSIFGSAFDNEDLDTYNSPFANQVMGAEANFNNMEPSTIVEAMQEELLQFKIQKDSPIILEVFSDSDYASASLDRKSIIGCCQFLGSSYGPSLWIQKSDVGIMDNNFNMQTKIYVDNENVRLIDMVKMHTDNNVADLLTKAFDVSRFSFLVASICVLNLELHNLKELMVFKMHVVYTSAIWIKVGMDYNCTACYHLVHNQEPKGEAHIEQLLPSPTTYQRKRKTQTRKRTKKDTQLPQTSVPQDLEADEVVHKEGGDSVERAITTTSSLAEWIQVAVLGAKIPWGAPPHTRSERVLEHPIEPPLSEVTHSNNLEVGGQE
ncbi:hypothetical protein Tco_0268693 [Tanacetum coccineum]